MARGRSDQPFDGGAVAGGDVRDAYGRPLDAYGRPVDAYDRLVDAHGRLVDRYGRPVDEYGRLVDQYGRPVDEDGRLIDPWADPAPTVAPGAAPAARRAGRRGAHLGPLAITPTRVTLLIALIGSAGFLAYAITVRDTSQIPLLASGAAVLGIVFAALALSGAMAAVRAGREGAGGRAFAMALGGGVSSVIAFACFGAAIVLGLVWRP